MRWILLLPLVALCACSSTSGLGRAMSYPSSFTKVTMPDDTYRVFDHATDKTIMTTPSIGAAVGSGAVQGATLGVVSVASPEQRHEAAARKYLDQTNRQDCEIVSGYLVVKLQYEFTYRCPTASAAERS